MRQAFLLSFFEASELFSLLGMASVPNGHPVGDYRERLSHYKAAETEKNEMITVSCY